MKLKNIVYLHLILFLLVSLPSALKAQETESAASTAPVKELIKNTFENGVVINSQTVETPGHKSLDFMIQHRFGLIENEKNLFGIYAPANIRLGLTYGITKNLALGLGVTKNKMIYDFNWKYKVLSQTKGSGTPVTITYYGNIARSTVDKTNLTDMEGVFKDTYRMSYFHELMFARKINSKISLQVAAAYMHFNIVDSDYVDHDFYGAIFTGRYRFSPQSSVIVDFDYLLNVSNIDEDDQPKPNFGLGYEVSTGSHQFQIFVCTSSSIVTQENMLYNMNDFTKRDLVFGFNITRAWGFK